MLKIVVECWCCENPTLSFQRPRGEGGAPSGRCITPEIWHLLLGPSLRWCFLGRDPVNFFAQKFLGEANALQDAFAVLDHVGMTAQISHTVFRGDAPCVRILADQLIHAT